MGLLVTAKLLNVQVPYFYKFAVDSLAHGGAEAAAGATAASVGLFAVAGWSPAALLVAYGTVRAGSALCNELRNAVFAKVGLGDPNGQMPSLHCLFNARLSSEPSDAN